MTRLTIIAFYLAIFVAVVFAWSPHPAVVIAYDKAQHGSEFIVLTILGRAAHPRCPWQRFGLTLAILGAIIELVQAIPALHRTCDVYEWYADLFAIGLGLALHGSFSLFRSAARKPDDT